MNPCRCGHALDPGFACKRQQTERCAAQYQARLSGPLLDRFDLRIEVPAVTVADLLLPAPSEGAHEVALRVARAHDRQRRRYEALGLPGIGANAAAPANVLERVVDRDANGTALIREASERFALTAHGFHRVLKLARHRRSRRRRQRVAPSSGRGAALPRRPRRRARGGVSAEC